MRYEHLNEEELRIIAKQRIKLKQGMKTHVLVFLLVNLFLTILYFVATPGLRVLASFENPDFDSPSGRSWDEGDDFPAFDNRINKSVVLRAN